MVYSYLCNTVDRPPMRSRRLKGIRVAALLASCCLPSVPSLAQSQDCAPAPTSPLASTLPTLKVGDYWIYEQSGTLTPPPGSTAGGPPAAAGSAPVGSAGVSGSTPSDPSASGPASGPVPISGSLVETVETRPFQGQPTLALVVVQNLTGPGGVSLYGNNPAPQQIFYIEQDPATNNILIIGDNAGPNGTDRVATAPAELYPGTFSTSTTINETYAYTSGDQASPYFNVTGTTTVATHIGTFDAWAVADGITYTTGGATYTSTRTDNWAPQVGAPVLFSTSANLPDGSVSNLSGTLIKSSRVLSLYPVLADKLSHPRGIAFDLLGDLWFTEAGVGGTGPCIAFMGNSNCFGNTGKVSVLVRGQQFTLVSNLASLATPLVDQSSGPNGITFNGEGRPYVIIGDGGPQSAVNGLGSLQSQTGVLLTAGLTKSGLAVQTVASVANYEYANNPDNRPNPDGTITPESNPYGVTSVGQNVYVADAAAHTVLQVTPDKTISVVGVVPNQLIDLPAFPGGPVPTVEDSVPTGVTPAPGGKGVLVADYTGYPYFPGTSRIWQVQAGQAPQVFASGFTNLIGLSPASDGGVYALEMASKGATSGDPGGSVIHVSPSGQQTVLACQGLIQPTGIATGPDGNVYVSNYGVTPGYGQVVEVSTTK